MTIQTVRFVNLWDLLQGHEAVKQAIADGDWSSITWGDANHTLISPERFKDEILFELEDVDASEVQRLIDSLDRDVYLDMES